MLKFASLVAVVSALVLGTVARTEDPKKEPTGPKPPTFKAPKEWKELERDKFGIATARFGIGEGEKQVVVTLVTARGTLADNVNRWRNQVGLDSLDEEAVLKTLKPIKVDGLPGHILDVTGPEKEGKITQRIVGIVVLVGEATWFIRMGGPADRKSVV